MLLQLPAACEHQLFMASDQNNGVKACDEIAHWAYHHGYELAQPDRAYIIFQNGTPLREWSLLERPQD